VRGELVALWCLAWIPFALPSRRWAFSAVFLACGLLLRAWARLHIGAHSRGRKLACPERVVGGPYRWFPHPLYLSNVLVLLGLASCAVGPRPSLVAWALSGPVVLYATLSVAESRLLRAQAPPPRTSRQDAASGRWTSEWASVLPPILAWLWEMR